MKSKLRLNASRFFYYIFNPAFCKYYVPVAQPLFKDTVKRFQK